MNDRMKNFYMSLANECSKLSRAVRLQVGCVIVKENNIISFSWNGTPSGWDNNCEDIELMDPGAPALFHPEEIDVKWPYEGRFWIDGQEVISKYRLKTKPEVLHAESNSVAKLAKSNNSGLGADLFVTHSPCIDCAKLIYQSGIRRVYFGKNYRDDAGIRFLEKSGVEVQQVSINNNNIS
jgi:dCMP deaminase